MKSITSISVRQPWAWLIIHGPKRFENRDWTETYLKAQLSQIKLGDRIAIHAAKGMTHDEYQLADDLEMTGKFPLPSFEELQRGGLIGTVIFNGIVRESNDPWFFGPLALRLDDPQPMDFYPCGGRLGFFKVNV